MKVVTQCHQLPHGNVSDVTFWLRTLKKVVFKTALRYHLANDDNRYFNTIGFDHLHIVAVVSLFLSQKELTKIVSCIEMMQDLN